MFPGLPYQKGLKQKEKWQNAIYLCALRSKLQ